MPAWLGATLRYTLTIIGIYLVHRNIVPETAWDEIAAATTALISALWGVWKTRAMEQASERNLELLGEAVAILNERG